MCFRISFRFVMLYSILYFVKKVNITSLQPTANVNVGHLTTVHRETRVEWPLPTVETEMNGDSKSTNERGSFLCWFVGYTEYISLQEMKQGQCICPLSRSIHCNFTGDGKCNERGWACTPHPHH